MDEHVQNTHKYNTTFNDLNDDGDDDVVDDDGDDDDDDDDDDDGDVEVQRWKQITI